jgi:hypothetical protein
MSSCALGDGVLTLSLSPRGTIYNSSGFDRVRGNNLKQAIVSSRLLKPAFSPPGMDLLTQEVKALRAAETLGWSMARFRAVMVRVSRPLVAASSHAILCADQWRAQKRAVDERVHVRSAVLARPDGRGYPPGFIHRQDGESRLDGAVLLDASRRSL